MKAKVILFVVEGSSDEAAFMPWIEEELKRLKLKVTVKVVRGDILTKYIEYSKEFEVNPSNVKGEVKKLINNYLQSSLVKSNQIKLNDIEKVYYVTDTDDCFMDENNNSINKRKCLMKMFNFESLEMNLKKNIKFEVIFFAENLEDVICSKKSATDEEKKRISIEFGKKSMKESDFFRNVFINQNLKIWDSYIESYDGIKEYKGRACNMNVLIKEIDNKNLIE